MVSLLIQLGKGLSKKPTSSACYELGAHSNVWVPFVYSGVLKQSHSVVLYKAQIALILILRGHNIQVPSQANLAEIYLDQLRCDVTNVQGSYM